MISGHRVPVVGEWVSPVGWGEACPGPGWAMGSPPWTCPQSSPLPACTPLPYDRDGPPDGRPSPGLASVGPPRHQHAPGQDCPSQGPRAVPAFTVPSRVCSGPLCDHSHFPSLEHLPGPRSPTPLTLHTPSHFPFAPWLPSPGHCTFP